MERPFLPGALCAAVAGATRASDGHTTYTYVLMRVVRDRVKLRHWELDD